MFKDWSTQTHSVSERCGDIKGYQLGKGDILLFAASKEVHVTWVKKISWNNVNIEPKTVNIPQRPKTTALLVACIDQN